MTRLMPKPALVVLAVAVLAGSALPILAQSGSRELSPRTTLSLDFAGGTALDYINAIRSAQPSANIIVLGDLQRISMAAAKLRDVDAWSALRVLTELPTDSGNMVAKVRLENVAVAPDSPPVFTVTADIKDRGPAPGITHSTVISLADLLGENLKADEALSAIGTAMELIEQPAKPAQLKFHEETGLLIARGSPEQVDTVRAVIEQLRERQGTLEVRAQQAAAASAMTEQMHLAVDRQNKARGEADALAREVTQWRTKAELLQATVDELRSNLSKLESALRASEMERDTLMRKIGDLQSKVEESKP